MAIKELKINKRPRYFAGQYLLEDDFELEQDYARDRLQRYTLSLHVSGIADGLIASKPNDATLKLIVDISAGTAIDPQGRQVVLLESRQVDLSKDLAETVALNNGDYILYIGYDEQESEPQDGSANTNRRILENPRFKLSSSAASDDFMAIAKLTIKDGIVSISSDSSVRKYTGLRLPSSSDNPLTLRSGDDRASNLAVLSGSLSVEGSLSVTGNVGIGTTNPTEKLEVAGNVKITGERLKSANGLGIVETNKKDWLRINPDQSYPAIALHKPVAIGTGGLAIGEWTQPAQGVLKVTQNAYLATAGGNVGIGTITPSEKLEVSGNIKATGTLYAAGNPLAYENYEIYVRGSGLESHDADGTNITHLKIANVQIPMESRRGINTTILRPNGTYKIKADHDVFESAQVWNTWADWIETNATDGDVVAAASCDAIQKIPKGGAAETLLNSIGAWKAFDPNCYHRVSYALLFIKGRRGAMEVLQPIKGANAHLKTTYYHLLNNEGAVVRGMIMMWSGEATGIPGGWALCDGQNGTPDLRDKFLVGAGQQYKENEKGEGDKHGHSLSGIVINGNTQNAGQHTHGISRQLSEVARKAGMVTATKDVYEATSDTSGLSGNHNHSFSVDLQNQQTVEVQAIRPPWYALCFIMKL